MLFENVFVSFPPKLFGDPLLISGISVVVAMSEPLSLLPGRFRTLLLLLPRIGLAEKSGGVFRWDKDEEGEDSQPVAM